MQTFWQDLRYGLRMLLKRPAFTLISIITLALGIGANTAIFSVINAVLLQALPYHDSQRLVVVAASDASGERDVISIDEARDFSAQFTTLSDFTAFQSQSVNLTGGDQPERIRGAFVAADFFKVFNLSPVAGRTFITGEDQPGAARVAVVNEGFWQRYLNAATDLRDKKVILNGEPFSVIGVVTG